MNVGDRVRLIQSIWDHGEDHHPSGWIALAGEVVVVRGIGEGGCLAVAHEGETERAFWIAPDEYEAMQ